MQHFKTFDNVVLWPFQLTSLLHVLSLLPLLPNIHPSQLPNLQQSKQ